MTEDEIADLIAACYAAAAGATPWSTVRAEFCRAFRAPFAGLLIGDPHIDGRLVNVFDNDAPLPAWRMRNPFVEASRRLWAGTSGLRPVVALGPEIVDDRQYVRGQYYADHARQLEMRHEVGTMVAADRTSMTCFGLYRPERAGPFDERDRAALTAVRPHLRRALQLRETLRPALTLALTGLAALDAMSRAAILVDRDLRVVHANAAAERMARQGGGLVLSARTREGDGIGGTWVSMAGRDADGALRRLVEAVAVLGRPGSALRLPLVSGATGGLIVAVLPLPAALLPSQRASGTADGLAVLLLRDGVSRPAVPSHVLCELFGLTRAEAEVAVLLGSGASPAQVAQARGVSLGTVRLQVHSIMRRTGTRSLRDLDHMLGTVADVVPGGGEAPS